MSASNEEISRVLVRYRAYLTAYIWSIVHDEHLVEDVLQDAISIALKRADEIRDKGVLVAWMRSTCRNLSLAALRKKDKRMILLSDFAIDRLESAWGEIEVQSDSDRINALRSCLSSLNPSAKELLRLKYSENLNSDEIARHREIKKESVYIAMSRIIAKLRECVNRHLSFETKGVGDVSR